MPAILDQRPLTLSEAAEFLGYKPSYLYRLTSQGRIGFSKPSGGRILFTREDLTAFVAQGRRPADFELREQADKIALKAGRR